MVWAVFEAIGAGVLCYYLPRAAFVHRAETNQ